VRQSILRLARSRFTEFFDSEMQVTVIDWVHKLAADLGIKRADIVYYQAIDAGYAGKCCSLCDEYGLLVQEDGTKLRTVDPFKELREKGRVRRAAQKAAGTRNVDQPA
jgi:hypothetical protein